MHPEYRQILATYLANLGVDLVTLDAPEGTISPAELAAAVNHETACVLVQHPNFFGCLEEVEQAAEIAHKAGRCWSCRSIRSALGLLKRPGDYGADIVVAEGQSLGNPMSFGGPYLGASWPAASSSCVACPAGWSARRSTAAAGAVGC